jgi:hypothetical protein
MLKQQTGRSSSRTFTWDVKSSDPAILQLTSPAEIVSGCSDCTGGCGIAKLEQRKKKTKPERLITR